MAKMRKIVDNYADARTAYIIGRRNKDGNVTLGNNTVLVERTHREESGDDYVDVTDYAIRLHDTDVVTFKRDGRILLNSGGWVSTTTADRFNTFTPGNMRINRKNGEYVVTFLGAGGDYVMGTFINTMTVL